MLLIASASSLDASVSFDLDTDGKFFEVQFTEPDV